MAAIAVGLEERRRLQRLEGSFYGAGAVFENADGARPWDMVRGFEGQAVGAFGDMERGWSGAYEFFVEKDFGAAGT
jgi:hypothetical protein